MASERAGRAGGQRVRQRARCSRMGGEPAGSLAKTGRPKAAAVAAPALAARKRTKGNDSQEERASGRASEQASDLERALCSWLGQRARASKPGERAGGRACATGCWRRRLLASAQPMGTMARQAAHVEPARVQRQTWRRRAEVVAGWLLLSLLLPPPPPLLLLLALWLSLSTAAPLPRDLRASRLCAQKPASQPAGRVQGDFVCARLRALLPSPLGQIRSWERVRRRSAWQTVGERQAPTPRRRWRRRALRLGRRPGERAARSLRRPGPGLRDKLGRPASVCAAAAAADETNSRRARTLFGGCS